MQKYEIQKLRDLPIERVAEQMGMEVKRHKALCPFHDDHHASLTFNTRKNNCRCYVCMSNSVGTIDLVMRFLRKDFLSACRWLAEVNGVYLEDRRKREASSSASCSTSYSASYSASHSASCSASSPGGSSSGGSSSEDNSGGSFSGNDSGGSFSGKSSSFDASRYAGFFEHPWLNGAARRFLFEERRIDERVARWCRLTSWTDRKGVNWLQIPYFDMEGNLIGIQNRNLDYKKNQKILRDAKISSSLKVSSSSKDSVDSEVSSSLKDSSSQATSSSLKDSEDSEVSSSSKDSSSQATSSSSKNSMDSEDSQDAPRFRFPYGARCSIYNLPVVKMLKPGEKLFITEGCSDCWAMLSAGHKAIAIPSATLLKPDDKKWLAEIGLQLKIEWHMFPDRDTPGESLFLQLKEILPSLVHHQLPPGCKDFSEFYLKEKK